MKFGKYIDIKPQNSQKLEIIDDKSKFIDLVKKINSLWDRTNTISDNFDILIDNYDESFYHVIDELLNLHYGEIKSQFLIWWIFDRFDDEGNLVPITYSNEMNNTEEEIFINTEDELWLFLIRVEKLIQIKK